MKAVYRSFGADEEIPVLPLLKKRKLFKYYNRESMAAVLVADGFLKANPVPGDTAFFYASAEVENYSVFRDIYDRYLQSGMEEFDAAGYIAMTPPQSQFKMMRNMVSCFISIENELRGDNNIIVDSASALLYSAITARTESEVLLGAGFLHYDGSVESGFALARPDELLHNPLLGMDAPAIEFFRKCQ